MFLERRLTIWLNEQFGLVVFQISHHLKSFWDSHMTRLVNLLMFSWISIGETRSGIVLSCPTFYHNGMIFARFCISILGCILPCYPFCNFYFLVTSSSVKECHRYSQNQCISKVFLIDYASIFITSFALIQTVQSHFLKIFD